MQATSIAFWRCGIPSREKYGPTTSVNKNQRHKKNRVVAHGEGDHHPRIPNLRSLQPNDRGKKLLKLRKGHQVVLHRRVTRACLGTCVENPLTPEMRAAQACLRHIRLLHGALIRFMRLIIVNMGLWRWDPPAWCTDIQWRPRESLMMQACPKNSLPSEMCVRVVTHQLNR